MTAEESATLDALATSENSTALLAAVQRAEALRLPSAIPLLMRVMEHTDEDELVCACAHALAVLEARASVALLNRVLQQRLHAYEQLVSSVPEVTHPSETYAVAVVQQRFEAREVLLELAKALGTLAPIEELEVLDEGVRSNDVFVRRACLLARMASKAMDARSLELLRVPPSSRQKEGSRDWLFRLLHRPDSENSVRLYWNQVLLGVGALGELPIGWPVSREMALRAWVRTQENSNAERERTPRAGAVFLVLDGNEPWKRALLTRKDHLHPVRVFRGKLAIPGGSLEEGESAIEGCTRELYEELRSTVLCDELAAALEHRGHFTPSFDFERKVLTYELDVFVAVARSAAVFDRWMTLASHADAWAEASPVLCGREELCALLESPSVDDGFVAGHGRVLKAVLGV